MTVDLQAILTGVGITLVSSLLLWVASTTLRIRDDVRSLIQEVRGMNGGGLAGKVAALEAWRMEVPERIRQAKHDAVNDLTPVIGKFELDSRDRDDGLDARIRALEVAG